MSVMNCQAARAVDRGVSDARSRTAEKCVRCGVRGRNDDHRLDSRLARASHVGRCSAFARPG